IADGVRNRAGGFGKQYRTLICPANQSAFAQSPAGFAVLCSRTHQRSNGTFVCFFLQLFLSNKEKVDRFPLSKGNIL
ncbi:MAG: hypothetical protein IJD59_02135, partial [Clostridia bacterium]|nr:hypothetical protein [Clostridia bacterium]